MASRRLRLDRTLGPVVVRWIERNLVHGPGDVQGQRVELDDEQVRFLLRAYEIDGAGRRLVRRAVYSRPKGRAKSELLAFVACAEALGPVRFRGWGEDGRPLGGTVRSPLIRLAATEEGQAGNTYGPVEFMLREGAVSATPGLDVGLTRTFLPDGGKILPITAKASSKDGGLETFVGFDETHLYVLPEHHRLHSTIRRNLGKRKAAEAWGMETSTMYAPGEGSVAEHSHAYAKAIRAGQLKDVSFLFDHRQARGDFDFDDDGQLRSALLEAYGEAGGWIDTERLIAEARDPQTDQNDFRRYFLNQPVERTQGKWIPQEKWGALEDAGAEIPPLAAVVVGADAAQTRDTTAVGWAYQRDDGRVLVGCRVWTIRPEKEVSAHEYVGGERLDNDDARDFVRDDLLRRFTARRLFYDERYFGDQARDLSDEDGMEVVPLHQSDREMRDAWNDFHKAVLDGMVVHDGDPVLAAHVDAAAGKKVEDGWKVSKLKSSKPIDGLAAVVMAYYGLTRHGGVSKYEERELLVI